MPQHQSHSVADTSRAAHGALKRGRRVPQHEQVFRVIFDHRDSPAGVTRAEIAAHFRALGPAGRPLDQEARVSARVAHLIAVGSVLVVGKRADRVTGNAESEALRPAPGARPAQDPAPWKSGEQQDLFTAEARRAQRTTTERKP